MADAQLPTTPSPRRKQFMVIVWAIVIIAGAMCCFATVAGPKFGSFHRQSVDALTGSDDGGR